MSLTRTSPSKQPLGSRITTQLGWGPVAGSLAQSGGPRDPPLEKMTGGSQERLASLFPLRVGRGPVAGRVGTSGGSHLFPAARQTHGVTSGPWAPAHSPSPPSHAPRVPGSFNHLGTLPRSLLTGWAVPRLGSGGPTAPSSAAGSNSRGAGSGAGGGGGVPAALDMHLETEAQRPRWRALCQWAPPPSVNTHLAASTSAADGETVCSSSLGSR